MDADCLRIATQLGCNLVGRLADPAQQHHLRVEFPIGRRVMAPSQLTHLAFFLRILRRSRFHLLGHLCAPPSSDHLPSILSPLRNAALRSVKSLSLSKGELLMSQHNMSATPQKWYDS